MNIGTLTIEMAANIARIRSDMDEARRVVGAAMGDVERYVGLAKTAFVSLGGVLSVNAFVHMVDGIVETKARLVDLSSQTGITVEALGALTNTGRLTSTSIDTITTASAKLSKAVQTSTADSKGAAEAIKALGLDFDRFKQLRPEDQLVTVARAMAGFADGSGKTAAAMELFGKTGAQLLPFMKDLSERTDLTSQTTREAAERADQFKDNLEKLRIAGDEWKGMIVDRMTPALAEFTRQMVEAKTWSERFGAIWGNIKGNLGFDALGQAESKAKAASAEIERVTNIMVGLSNVLEREPGNENARRRYDNLAAKLRQLQADASKATDELKGLANVDREDYSNEGRTRPKPEIKGLAGESDAAKAQREAYLQLVKSIKEKIATEQAELDSVEKLTDAQRTRAKILADIEGGLTKLSPTQKRAVEQLLEQLVAVDKLNAAKEKERQWLEETRKENERALEVQSERVRADEQLVRQFDDELEAFGKTRDELQALSSARDRDSAAVLRQRASVLDTEGPMGQMRDLYLQQADALERLAARKDQLAAKEARESNDATAGATRAVRDYLDTVKRAGDATHSLITDSLGSLEDGLAGLAVRKKFDVKAWVDQIIAEMFRLAVVKPLLASIFGGGTSGGGQGWLSQVIGAVGSWAGSSLGGGGLTVDTGGMGTNLTGGGLPTRGGLAGGGQARAGARYLVGENGPEILQMGDQAGTVIPNGGASRPVQVNIVNNGAPVTAKSSQRETPQGTIVDLILDTVAADVDAGGRVADAHSRRFGANGAAGVPRY